MKKALVLILVAVLLLTLAGCAASPNALTNTPDASGKVAGFWLGLWHGIIAPFTLIISLFSKTVVMYEVHNNGAWYNFGFLLGMIILCGGGGGGVVARRRTRKGCL
jgi:hypothetical protein